MTRYSTATPTAQVPTHPRARPNRPHVSHLVTKTGSGGLKTRSPSTIDYNQGYDVAGSRIIDWPIQRQRSAATLKSPPIQPSHFIQQDIRPVNRWVASCSIPYEPMPAL